MSTKDISYIALFAALTAVFGLIPPIAFPIFGVPVSAQTLGPMLAGAILGMKRGALSQVLLIVLVLAGLPLLSGGRGGFGVLFGPTAGFLLAWPLGAAFIGFFFERNWERLTALRAAVYVTLGSIGVFYALGIPWVSINAGIPLEKAAPSSLAFIPGDIIKVIVTVSVAMTVRRSYPLIAQR